MSFKGYYKSDRRAVAVINQTKKIERHLDSLLEKQKEQPVFERAVVIMELESLLDKVKNKQFV